MGAWPFILTHHPKKKDLPPKSSTGKSGGNYINMIKQTNAEIRRLPHYCYWCQEDFETIEELVEHKINCVVKDE